MAVRSNELGFFLMSNVHHHSEASKHKDRRFLRLYVPLNWLFIAGISICSPFHTDLEKEHKHK